MKKILMLTLVLTSLLACEKYNLNDVKIAPWEPEIALPIINSEFSVQDIFEFGDSASLSILNSDEGLLGVTYSGTIFSFDAELIAHIGNNQMEETITYPNPGLPIAISDTVESSQVFRVNFNLQDEENSEIHEMKILNGFLHLEINSGMAYPTQIKITIPNAIKNGQPFDYAVSVEPGQSNINNFDMSEYVYDLTAENLGFSQIRIEYQLVISYDPAIPSGNNQMSISTNFNNAKYEYLLGYFGQNTIVQDVDTIALELFNNTVSGHFQFLDPFLKITTTNSFGIPLQATITEFSGITLNNQSFPITLEGITDSPFIIGYPNSLGESITQTYEFDNSNSTIEDVLNDGTKKIVWGIEALTSPDGPTPNLNFISHNSRVAVQTAITLPLKGYAWDWLFKDTLSIDLSDSPEELVEATLHLVMANGFPMVANAQIYMTDSIQQVTDSLFGEPALFLESGILNGEGIVDQAKKTTTDIELKDEKLKHFLAAKYLIVRIGLETTNGQQQQVVQIYDDYTLGLIIGIKGKVTANPDDL